MANNPSNNTHLHTLPKAEHLCSNKEMTDLFANGTSFVKYPLRIVFAPSTTTTPRPTQILISVPKKRFKHAVDRNRIKRLVREAYRLNKQLLCPPQPLNIAFIYIDNQLPTFASVQKAVVAALSKMEKTYQTNTEQ